MPVTPVPDAPRPTIEACVHHMYTVIDVGQLGLYGVTYWLPLASAANIAQGAATLAKLQ